MQGWESDNMDFYKCAIHESTVSYLTCSYCKKVFTDTLILACYHGLCFPCAGEILSKAEMEGGCCCPECGSAVRGNFFHNLQFGNVDVTRKLMNEVASSYGVCPPKSTDIPWCEWDEISGDSISEVSACSIASIETPPSMVHENPAVVSKEVPDLKKRKSTPSPVTENLIKEVASSYSRCPSESTDIASSEGYWTGSEVPISERSVSSGCSIASIETPPYMGHENPAVVSKEVPDLKKRKSTPSAAHPRRRAPDSEPGFKPGSAGAGPGPSPPVQSLHRQEYSEAAGPPAPCQIIGLDNDSKLIVHEEELKSCLEQKRVWNHAVCFISVIGEQCKGKSFLMNYVLRRLRNLGVTDESWMGRDDEPLEGFDWRPGINSTTKGVWMWNKPFLAERDGQKIAIFLVDTQGSFDIEQDKEAIVKLSAFSMLTSSYLIYNVATTLKEPDLEYLEMFVHVAEEVGKAFSLQPIQHLEILVRDHFYGQEFGSGPGQKYLRDVIKRLEMSHKYKRSLELLQSRASCYLLPFPGKKIASSGQGSLSDMDKDFRDFLKKYVHDVVTSTVQRCVKTESSGDVLTCGNLVGKIKKFVEIMKTREYGFSSPLEMTVTLNNMMELENFRKQFRQTLQKEKENSDNFVKILKTTPKEMKEKLELCGEGLLALCKNKLQGDEDKKQKDLNLLSDQLQEDLKDYTSGYAKKFMTTAIKTGAAVGAVGIGLVGGAIYCGIAAGTLLTNKALRAATAAAMVGGEVWAKLGSMFAGTKKRKKSEEGQ